MVGKVNLLVVSSRLEMKRDLLQLLDQLPLNVYAAGCVEHADDTLQRLEFNAILCDEYLSDGTYHDVLGLTLDKFPRTQFILLQTAGGPEESREARQLGVAEVIPTRFEPTDIELALIHTMRGPARVAHAAA